MNLDRQPEIDLSVVIPAYNEARRIGPSLDRLLAFLDRRAAASGSASEVLVVDDGSRDGTADAARRDGVTVLGDGVNRGKGAALRRGVLASRGRLVLLSDADFSTPIEELSKLEAALKRAPVAFGSRAVADARIERHQPLYRELMGKTFNVLIRLAGVRGLRDTQCGFKLLEGDVARRLFADLHTPGFAYDVELAWLARRSGLSIAEIGVVWVNSPDSRVRPIRDAINMLFEIARFRWLHRGQKRE